MKPEGAAALKSEPAAALSRRSDATFWRMLRNPQVAAAGVLLLALGLVALLGPLLVPFEPTEQHLAARLKPPGTVFRDGRIFLAGTDQFGRDVLSRLIVGMRVPLLIALCATVLGSVIGTAAGLVAGYLGGWADTLIGILIDCQLALPFILIGLLTVVLFGANAPNIVLVFTFLSWPISARAARASARALARAPFVEASRAAGARSVHIILKEVLPNAVSPIVVIATVQVGTFIIYEAAFGFFGLGIAPPEPTWGNMLADSRNYLAQAWWLGICPGLCIAVVVMTVMALGDGMRRTLDPRAQPRAAL